MQKCFLVFVVWVLTACSDPLDDVPDNSNGIDLTNLPVTFVTTIEMDSIVEEGVDAFAGFNSGSEELIASISKEVGDLAGIDIDYEFSGEVELTISGEHEISNAINRIYSVSSIKKK